MTVELRRLTGADAEAYRALFLAGLDRDPEAFLVSRAEAEAQPIEATRERLTGGWVFGAFAGSELVAIVGGRRLALARQAHRMSVGPVYVSHAARGRGLARRLLDALVAAAGADGLLQLELEVAADNAAALRLYGSAGFRRTGIIPRSVRTGSGFGDDVAMVRRLD